MSNKIVYIGLDVDDTQYHGAALNKTTGELHNFKCKPTRMQSSMTRLIFGKLILLFD